MNQIRIDTFSGEAPINGTAWAAADAALAWAKYPREHSPDGKETMLYDYSVREQTAPSRTHAGNDTTYGDGMAPPAFCAKRRS